MLGRLDGAVSLGESHQLWVAGLLEDRLCGCGSRFSRCPFWREVGELAFGPGGWSTLDRDRAVRLRLLLDRPWMVPLLLMPRPPLLTRAVAEYAGLLRQVFQAVADVSGASVVVDSSKIASHALLVRRGVSDVRLLHLVRDSRGVLYSWQKAIRRQDTEGQGPHTLMHRYHIGSGAFRYLAFNLLAQLLGGTNLPYRRIRYEDLVQNPAMVLDEVADFSGIGVPDRLREALTEHHLLLGVDHTIDGNPMRLAQGEMSIRHDDEWRRSMSSLSRATATVLTLPLLLAYRYLWGGPGRRAEPSRSPTALPGHRRDAEALGPR